MDIQVKKIPEASYQLKFFIEHESVIVARTFLVIIQNELHAQPYGLIEDVFVEEVHRGKGYASQLVQRAIDEAKEIGCYKILIQSRYGKEKIHSWYQRFGFVDHGKNFRMDLI